MLELGVEALELRGCQILQPGVLAMQFVEKQPHEIKHAVIESAFDGAGLVGGLVIGQAAVMGEDPDLVIGLVETGIGPERAWYAGRGLPRAAALGMRIEEGEIAPRRPFRAQEILVDLFQLRIDPGAILDRVVEIQIEIAQQDEVLALIPAESVTRT